MNRTLAIAGAIYLFASLLFTWPVGRDFTGQIAGYGDSELMCWSFWWMHHSIAVLHQFPLLSDFQNYPLGTPYLANSLATFWAFMTLPVTHWLGPVASWNLSITLVLPLNAISAYCLLRSYGRCFASALFGGFLFGFNPSIVNHLCAGHLNVSSVAALPWVFEYYRQLATVLTEKNRPPLSLIAKCSLWLTLAALLQIEQLVFFSTVLLLLLVCIRPHILKFGAWVFVSAIPLLPLVLHVTSLSLDPLPHWGLAEFTGCNLLGFLLPSPKHVWLGEWVDGVRHSWAPRGVLFGDEGVATLGVGLVCLLLMSWYSRKHFLDAKFWWKVFVVYFVLSLGVRLQIGPWGDAEQVTFWELDQLKFGIPLPMTLCHYLPILKQFRAPGRFYLLEMLPVAILVSGAIDSAKRRPLVYGLMLLALFEFMPGRFPVRSLRPNLAFSALAHVDANATVLPIPLGWHGSLYDMGTVPPGLLEDQFSHKKRLMGGQVARIPRAGLLYFLQSPFLRELLTWENLENYTPSNIYSKKQPAPSSPNGPGSIGYLNMLRTNGSEVLKVFNVQYVVVYNSEKWPHTMAFLQNMVSLELLAEDGNVKVYTVKPMPLYRNNQP